MQAFPAEKSIELMSVHTGELNRLATDKGNSDKEQMIKAARQRGWSPVDDNEADSALLLEYALRKLDDVKTRSGECFIVKR